MAAHLVCVHAREWAVIDAVLDNAINYAVGQGDRFAVRQGREVRRAARNQLPLVGGNWPPMDLVISLTLDDLQWRLVAEAARSSLARSHDPDDSSTAILAAGLAAITESVVELRPGE